MNALKDVLAALRLSLAARRRACGATALLAAVGAVGISPLAEAAPFASNVVVSGTNVTFILNEPADTVGYRVNNGPLQLLSGASKGTKNFSLGAPGDNFTIAVGKSAATGYTIPTGGTIAIAGSGLSQPTAEAGFAQLSSDADNFSKYNSPRGVSVSNDPNAPNFGTVYISNSAAGTTGGRTLGDGMYAIRADQSDAFGYNNTAQDPNNKFDGVSASANSPFRVTVADNGEVYVADFSDANANVWRLNSNLTTNDQTLNVVNGPTVLPPGSNHGSTTAVYVEGSSATGDLVMYTLDEDLTTLVSTGAGSNTDKNSLWRYDINGSAFPFAGQPTKVNLTNELLPAATSDLDRGADGKFYLAQNRSAGAEAGIVVLDASGAKIYDSLTASRVLLANPTANDIIRNVLGMAVSEDQKWMAVLLNNSDVAVVPLVAGIPDLANRMVVNTGTDVNSGRDIAFDAAGNIHYASSGQALYKVLAPGGTTWARTSYRDGGLAFSVNTTPVPEPACLGLLGAACMVGMNLVRRRRAAR